MDRSKGLGRHPPPKPGSFVECVVAGKPWRWKTDPKTNKSFFVDVEAKASHWDAPPGWDEALKSKERDAATAAPKARPQPAGSAAAQAALGNNAKLVGKPKGLSDYWGKQGKVLRVDDKVASGNGVILQITLTDPHREKEVNVTMDDLEMLKSPPSGISRRGSAAEWACVTCTFLNDADRQICDGCSVPRDEGDAHHSF